MNTQEKRDLLVKEIQELPEAFLNEVAELIHQLKMNNKRTDEKYVSDQTFEHILKQTSEQYKEVWKALA